MSNLFQPSVVESTQIGGALVLNPSAKKVLIAQVTQGSTNRYSVFVDMSTNANYQVPLGKTLKIKALRFTNAETASACQGSLSYGDNAITDSVTAPTNIVSAGLNGNGGLYSAPSAGSCELPLQFSVPAQKYPHIFLTKGGSVIVIGEEV